MITNFQVTLHFRKLNKIIYIYNIHPYTRWTEQKLFIFLFCEGQQQKYVKKCEEYKLHIYTFKTCTRKRKKRNRLLELDTYIIKVFFFFVNFYKCVLYKCVYLWMFFRKKFIKWTFVAQVREISFALLIYIILYTFIICFF